MKLLIHIYLIKVIQQGGKTVLWKRTGKAIEAASLRERIIQNLVIHRVKNWPLVESWMLQNTSRGTGAGGLSPPGGRVS